MRSNQARTLVQQCFPPYQKNLAEWKANGPELSTLLFQMQSQGSRLAGVVSALEEIVRKSRKEGKTGYLIIATEILTAIVERCPAELGLYGSTGLDIVQLVVEFDDAAAVEAAAKPFETMCARQGKALLSADQDYFSKYSALVATFADLASKSRPSGRVRSSVAADQHGRARALNLLGAIARTESIRVDGKAQVNEVVPAMLENLVPADPEGLTRLVRLAGPRVRTIRRSLSAEREIEATATSTRDADRMGEDAVGLAAVDALRQLFEPSFTTRRQIAAATETIDRFVRRVGRTEPLDRVAGWANVLFGTVCVWAPMKDRFVILTTLLDLLRAVKDRADAVVEAGIIASLLSSDVGFVNLSVVDAVRTVLSALAPPGQSEELVGLLERCLVGFGTHVYYRGQIGDLVGCLLTRLRDDADLSVSARLVILRAVRKLLADRAPNLTDPAGVDAVPISVWEGTEHMLADEEVQVRHAWVAAWTAWVDQHSAAVSSGTASPTSATGSTRIVAAVVVAGYDLAHASRQSDQASRLAHALVSSFPRLGLDGLAESVGMVVALQEDIPTVTDLVDKIRIGAIAHGYFLSVIHAFELASSKVGTAIQAEIDRRTGAGLWVPGLTVPAEPTNWSEQETVHPDRSADPAFLDRIRSAALRPFDGREVLVMEIEKTIGMGPHTKAACLAAWDRVSAGRAVNSTGASRAASMTSRLSGRRAVSAAGLAGMPSSFDATQPANSLFMTTTVGVQRASRLLGSHTRLSAMSSMNSPSVLGSGAVHPLHQPQHVNPPMSIGGFGGGSGTTTPNRSTSSRLSLAAVSGLPLSASSNGGLKYEKLKQALLTTGKVENDGPDGSEHYHNNTPHLQQQPRQHQHNRYSHEEVAPPLPPIPSDLAKDPGWAKVNGHGITGDVFTAGSRPGGLSTSASSWPANVQGLLLQDDSDDESELVMMAGRVSITAPIEDQARPDRSSDSNGRTHDRSTGDVDDGSGNVFLLADLGSDSSGRQVESGDKVSKSKTPSAKDPSRPVTAVGGRGLEPPY